MNSSAPERAPSALPTPHEPLAIVGIGCRFPGGADNADAFWRLLRDGVDAISEIPADRWLIKPCYDRDPRKLGKLCSKWAGLIANIDRFDPLFFGIAPREAAAMDPQQRLLLELAWETLEDGGLVPETLAGSATGVFVGISTFDYANIQGQPSEWRPANPHVLLGTTLSIAANRISYVFDLRGPSLAVDTACSSSLVALHLACRSLWQAECELALVGGVNAILHPETSICFSNAGMLSPDGRCKSFDARANGYVRSEGGGMIALKPLSRAVRDNDRIYAVVLGTAVNQDGRTVGITAPNGAAQESVARTACRAASVEPNQIQYVEAHGTGTPVGDPIEANALGNVFGAGRPAHHFCLLGSVKTNIGHLEAGAGIAGVIKTALALQRRMVPASLHFETPNPYIDFDRCRLKVPVQLEPWPANGAQPRLAGVNSFGFGGTNAHAVLAAWEGEEKGGKGEGETGRQGDKKIGPRSILASSSPLLPLSPSPLLPFSPSPCLFPLSARSLADLQAAAGALADWLAANAEVSLADLAYTTGLRRTHHAHRFAVVVDDLPQLVDKLDAFRRREARALLAVGRGNLEARVVFVFTGMGPQWWGMGRHLLSEEPVYRVAVEECDRLFHTHAGWSLLAELTAAESASRIDEPYVAQPTLFAVQVGLAALWRSWGVTPAAVVGHSVGEVAAAYVSGALTLSDALAVVFHRSRLQQRLRGQGRMLAVALPVEQMEQMPRPVHANAVTIASINSPSSVTLSGDADALEEMARSLERAGVFCRFLKVDVPYHSARMDGLHDELVRSLAALVPRTSSIPFVSTVSGQLANGPELDAEYWWRNVRQPVVFAKAINVLLETGCNAFLEFGPHPVLASSIAENAAALHRPVNVLASLRRGDDERGSLLESLGRLYMLGVPVAWKNLCPPGQMLSLPGYPWQRERFWRESEDSRQIRVGEARSLCPGLLGKEEHPLLGRAIQFAAAAIAGTRVWHVDLDLTLDHAWLADHRIQGAIVYPAAAYLETALAAVASADFSACTIDEIEFYAPLLMTIDKPQALELIVEDEQGCCSFFARELDGVWTRLVTGKQRLASVAPPEAISFADLRSRCPREIDGDEWYRQLHAAGYHYGELFRGVERVWCGTAECVAILRIPEPLTANLGDFLFHPAVLDSGIQLYQGTLPFAGVNQLNAGTFVPKSAERVVCHRPLSATFSGELRCHFRTRGGSGKDHGLSDVRFFDAAGQVLFEVIGLRSVRIGASPGDEAVPIRDCLYEYRWRTQDREAARPRAKEAGCWLIFVDQQGVGEGLANRLAERGERVVRVKIGEQFRPLGDDLFQVNPEHAADMQQLLHELSAMPVAWHGVVHLFSLDAPVPTEVAGWPDAGHVLGCVNVLNLVQACAAAEWTPPRLFLVTRGAQAVLPGETPHIAQTSLWGLGRVIRSEHPELRCTRIDLEPESSSEELRLLDEEISQEGAEDEIAFRDGKRHVHRLIPVAPAELQGACEIAGALPFRLEVATPGLLESLTLCERRRRTPGPTEVEIEIDTAALNFKDIAKALNLLSDESLRDTWSGRLLGMECVGKITARGPEVRGLEIGAAVVALAPGCLASHVTIDAATVMLKPTHLSDAEACTLPVAFMTAAYSLLELARMRRGDRVLIHAAAGGVGLAAVQLAQRVGAEILATAGSDEKRGFLRSLGIEHVMDSRTLNFADEILARTGGRGVDIVLNSLTGPAAARSLALLAPSGRFLELGKRAIEENARLGLRPFQNNLAFFAIDLDRLWLADPRAMGNALAEVVRQLRDGELKPLPYRVFPIAQAVEAFQWLARARHIGKVVLSMRDDPALRVVGADEATDAGRSTSKAPALFQADATYLITGGLGGFGGATARWLVERGARHLVLLGRSGADSAEGIAIVRALEKAGARVLAAKVDVAQADQLGKLLDAVRQTFPPLRGVFHAAMVLDDATLLKLDRARFDAVMAPKVGGAWNLHRLTRQNPLDCFVLFSSTAAVFGSVGQGNYAAANAFLDGLAHYRRALGLPALSVNWSAVADVGVVARNSAIRAHIERLGFIPLSSALMLRALGVLLRRGAIQTTVMRLDGARAGLHAVAAIAPRFYAIVGASPTPDTAAGLPLGERLRAADGPARQEMLTIALGEQIGRALGLSPGRIDTDAPLTSLGLDSLLAVDLAARLRREIGVEISVLKLLRGVTLNNLANDIQERLAGMATAERD